MLKGIFVCVLSVYLMGCTGTIYTVKNPQFDQDGETEGVLFYGYKVKDKPQILDRIRHPKTGEITHSAYEPSDSDAYCQPRTTTVRVVEPDFGSMYAIKYDPAWFETSSFSVGLEKGMLSSVNQESTPGPKSAVESLQGLVDVRSSVLKGVMEGSDQESKGLVSNITGDTPTKTSITCSTSQ